MPQCGLKDKKTIDVTSRSFINQLGQFQQICCRSWEKKKKGKFMSFSEQCNKPFGECDTSRRPLAPALLCCTKEEGNER